MPSKTKPTVIDPRWFDVLSPTALIREQQILPGPDNPSPLINVSPSTWWRWVRSGRVPAPHKLSSGVSAWRVAELRVFLDSPGTFKSFGMKRVLPRDEGRAS